MQFSGFVQVDAAAGVEEADEFGGGGAQEYRYFALLSTSYYL